MTPWADNQVRVVASRTRLRSRRCESGSRSIDILLIPLTVDIQGRHRQRPRGQNLIDRLSAPIMIVSRVLSQPLPERQLIHAQRLAQRAGGADLEPSGISVVA